MPDEKNGNDLDKIIHTIPFLRITVALAAGIVLGSLLQLNVLWLFICLLICIACLLWLNSQYSYSVEAYFGIGVHVFFIAAGMLLWRLYNIPPTFFEGDYYEAVVLEKPAEKSSSYQSVLRLNTVIAGNSAFNTDEKIMVWFKKNDISSLLQPGQTILFNRTPQTTSNSNNPFEFDYKKYLARKRIYRQVYLSDDAWQIYEKPSPFSLQILAEKVRSTLLDVYARQDWDEKQYDVISALTLGYKGELDAEVKNTFAAAGTMHVLAVSGLHTGILFFIVSFLFGFLKQHRYGRVVFVVLVISVLWAFAFVTGLSPSVKRAATMFMFVVIGQNMRRQVNIYNTLAASAFFLLITNPNLLYDAGFQLSYTAVFGIVFLQPKLDKIIVLNSRLMRYVWTLLTVSVAAQVITFPLSVYYFHQFPVYFWLSNLLVIPAVTVLIPLAFLLLAIHWIPVAASFTAFIIQYILDLQFQFLEFIEKLPVAKLTVFFSVWEFLLVLSILISLLLLIDTHRTAYLKQMLFCTLIFFFTSLSIHTYYLFQREIIIYNFSGQHVIHLISGKRNYIVSDVPVDKTPSVKPVINKVVSGLRLHEPELLTVNDTYIDSLLCLKNGMIYFAGQVVGFDSPDLLNETSLIPDITVFDNTVFTDIKNTAEVDSLLLVNHLNISRIVIKHNLRDEGAFIKHW